MAYGDKYYAIRGDIFGIGKAISGVSNFINKIPLAGAILKSPIGKVLTKFVPGVGLISTVSTVAGIASKGYQMATKGRGATAVLAPWTGSTALVGPVKALAATQGMGLAKGLALAGGGVAVTAGGVATARRMMNSSSGTNGGGGGGGSFGSGRRYRRMNPLNARAARRAIRRIRGARKMLGEIERSLPKAKARGATFAFQRRRRKAA